VALAIEVGTSLGKIKSFPQKCVVKRKCLPEKPLQQTNEAYNVPLAAIQHELK
jgi:hypothetical protein